MRADLTYVAHRGNSGIQHHHGREDEVPRSNASAGWVMQAKLARVATDVDRGLPRAARAGLDEKGVAGLQPTVAERGPGSLAGDAERDCPGRRMAQVGTISGVREETSWRSG
jgi:hypothetical protein